MSLGKFWVDHGEAVITTTVGAILGLVVSWLFFRAAKQRKELSWQLEVDEC